MEHRDAIRVHAKATIVAHCNVWRYVKMYEAIYTARNSALFEAAIDPTKLRNFTTNVYGFDRTKCVSFPKEFLCEKKKLISISHENQSTLHSPVQFIFTFCNQ